MRNPNQLRTSEAAKLAGVSTRLVCRWCDAKLFPVWRLPAVGNRVGERRIDREKFLEFLKEQGIPVVEGASQ